MGRFTNHACAFRALAVEQGGFTDDERYRRAVTWCGKTTLMSKREREAPIRLATCPKCAKAAGAFKLAKLGGRIAMRKAEGEAARRYRSAWVITIDGVERGLITNARGFGKPWDLELLPTARDDWRGTGGSVAGDPPSYWNRDRTSEDATFQPISYAARDAMAVAALRAAERGELPTVAEREARESERLAERERSRVESERLAAEREQERMRTAELRAERLETAKAALAELEGRADLSNLELAGLAAMRALLGLESA